MGFFQNSGMSNDVFNVSFQNGVEFKYDSAYQLFKGCTNFNAPVKIPDRIQDGASMFSGCTNLNSNIYIDPFESHLTRMNGMFYRCQSFNKNVNVPYNCSGVGDMLPNTYNASLHVYSQGETLYNPSDIGNFYGYFQSLNGNFNVIWHNTEPIILARAFEYCYELNTNINIPVSARNLHNAFYGCYNLNKNIRLHDRVDASGCFYECFNLNQNIRIPRLGNISGMFYSCWNLNQPMYVPEVNGDDYLEQRANIVGLFRDCRNLNNTITIDTNVKSMAGMFDGCANFNRPITIPSNVQDLAGTFKGCANFTQSVSIPSGVIDMTETFAERYNFTHHVDIPSSVQHMNATFRSTGIDSAITIPTGVTTLTSTFQSCKYFNTNITIPSSVTRMSDTFSGCSNLATAIELPENVVNIHGCFAYCDKLNEAIGIPDMVQDISTCFQGCNNFNQRVDIPDDCMVSSVFENAINYKQEVIVNHHNSAWYTDICAGTQVPSLTLNAPSYDWTHMKNVWHVHRNAIHQVIANASPNSTIFNLRLNNNATYPNGSSIKDYFSNQYAGPNMLGIPNIYQSPRSYTDYVENYQPRNYAFGGCTSWMNNIISPDMYAIYYDYPNCSNAEDVQNHQYYINLYFV